MCAETGLPPKAQQVAQDELRHLLRESWPFPCDIRSGDLPTAVDARTFVAAAMALQERGEIMYEVLLVGTGPQPCIRDALVTHKGLRG